LQRYSNTDYAPMVERVAEYMLKQGRDGLPPAEVGDLIWRCLTNPAPKTRYRILRNELMDVTVPRLLGPRRVDRIIAKRLGFPNRP